MTTRDSTTTIERHLSALHRVLLARDVDVGGVSVSSFSTVGGGGGGATTTTGDGDDDDDETARGLRGRVPISFASAREYAETYAALALEECEAIARRARAAAAGSDGAARATREDDVFHVVALDVEEGWDERGESGFRENDLVSLVRVEGGGRGRAGGTGGARAETGTRALGVVEDGTRMDGCECGCISRTVR